MDRLLRILQALIVALEGRGHSAVCDYAPTHRHVPGPAFALLIHGERVALEAKERGRVAAATEGKPSKGRSILDTPRRRFEPTGVMTLHFTAQYGSLNVADSISAKLETLLSDVPDRLERMAEGCRQRREAARIEAAERAKERERLAEEERKARQLDDLVAAWRRVTDIRAMMADIREIFAGAGISLQSEPTIHAFVEWAEGRADRIDPLREIRAHVEQARSEATPEQPRNDETSGGRLHKT